MKEWYSVAELAGLPGLPGTERGVLKICKRESWQSRPREHGKGNEYHITSLPSETRDHLLRQQAVTTVNAATLAELTTPDLITQVERRHAREAGLKRLAGLAADDPKKQYARAREWVLRRWADFATAHQVGTATCIGIFLDAYQSGEIAVPKLHAPWLPTRHNSRALDRSTLYRWQQRFRNHGRAGLIDAYGKRKGHTKIGTNEELQQIVLGCLQREPHIQPKKIKDYICAQHPDLNIISIKSIERFIKRWKLDNAQAWTHQTNPDAWKNTYKVAFGSQHENIERLNQLWEMDSTPGDWMLTDGRHVVIGVIDMYSRRLKFRVSKSSKADAVCALFRSTALAWGLAEAVRTDNGSDYVSAHFTDVLDDLDVEHLRCMPFASEQKGTIERSMRTMSHGILDLLPGFIGHNVAERKVIEARKSFAERIMQPGEVVEVALSSADLQVKLDQWCEYIYGRDAHEGLEGQSPFERATAWREPVRRISDERALDALLGEVVGTRAVTKKGIRLDHYHYTASELVEHVGHYMRLKRDIDDLGRLYVYSLDGTFVAIAQAHELLGYSPAESAAAAHAAQRRFLAGQREAARANKRAVRENIAETILEHRIAQAANVTALPHRGVAYTTPALEEAGIAARAGDPMPAAELTPEQQLQQDRLAEELSATVTPISSIDHPDMNVRHSGYLIIDALIRSGKDVAQRYRDFHARYPGTSEYRVQTMIFEDFGLKAEDYGVTAEDFQ